MEFDKKTLVFALLIALSTIVWGFFLNATGIEFIEVLKMSQINSTISILTSLNFILFALIFPLTYGLIVVLCRMTEKNQAYLVSLIAFAAGAIINYLVFAGTQQFFLVGLVYFVSIPLMIETTYMKLNEVKSMIMIRTAMAGAGKAITVLGLGLFLFTALLVSQNQQDFLDDFEQGMMESIAGNGETGTGIDLSDVSADLLINAQKQSIKQITGLPQYSALKTKEDADVQTFVVAMQTLEDNINSPEFREQIKAQVKEQQSSLLTQTTSQGSLLDMVKQRMPLFGLIEKYFWLMEAFMVASLFLTAGNIIFKPLAAGYAWILHGILGAVL